LLYATILIDLLNLVSWSSAVTDDAPVLLRTATHILTHWSASLLTR